MPLDLKIKLKVEEKLRATERKQAVNNRRPPDDKAPDYLSADNKKIRYIMDGHGYKLPVKLWELMAHDPGIQERQDRCSADSLFEVPMDIRRCRCLKYLPV
jgi:hypothetical protein